MIVSTRKLVYDAGSNEEAIKALMQAQHKAVMKDLRKGTFDEKIDQYLSGTPGLEPRTAGGAAPAGRGERAKTEADPEVAARALADSSAPIEIVNEGLSEPIELPIKKSRTDTGDKTIPITALPPKPGPELDAPTDVQATQPIQSRTKTANKGSKATDIGRAPTQLVGKPPPDAPAPMPRDSAPVIEMEIDDDELSERLRSIRDTNVEAVVGEDAPAQPAAQARPASHGAATLPAMKPPSRPIAPVVTRPPTQDRKRPDSDVVEVYSPAPASVEPPPGERAERPGQYSMSRKDSSTPPMREQTGRIQQVKPPTSNPPNKPRSGGTGGNAVVQQPSNARESGSIPRQAPPARPGAQPPPVPQRAATPPAGSRVPTPQPPNRVHATAPIANRTPSPATPPPGSGVVMTRPAVIVGAPPTNPKPSASPTQTRIRKAREDEGRGFGQGLISEKSLDEVILAYLSEDAEDK
ncbi:MAG TPA: hypothetical protein VL326_26350 [Kofleriaceae bacterium]|nr:hypothetical protein [Kofleriaceae bacterium]